MTARTPAVLFALLVLLAALPAVCPAGTIVYVDSLTDDGAGCTLREAVASANAGVNTGGCSASGYPLSDIGIAVKGTILLSSPITVSRGVSISGPSATVGGLAQWPNRVTIKTTGTGRSLIFDSPGNDQSFWLNGITFGGSTSGSGGGIKLGSGDTLALSTCIIRNCSASAGGGINSSGGTLKLYNSVVAGNEATGGKGGGIYLAGSSLLLANSTLSGNRAAGAGGGAYVQGNATVESSTFSGNRAGPGGGGAIFLAGGIYSVNSSILWGDAAAGGWPEIQVPSGLLAVSYSDVMDTAMEAVWPGTGNILATPRFEDPRPSSGAPDAGGDYHLKHTSPCINAADPTPIYASDIDGDLRFQDAGPDMGSDEAGPPRNDSFDYGAAVPRPWRGVNLAPGDGRVDDVKLSGSSSLRIAGGPGEKVVRQGFASAGGAGDQVIVAGWSKATGPSLSGGMYAVEAWLYSGSTPVTFARAGFSRTTHGWRYKQASITAPGAYDRVVVRLVYENQTGTAWFDDVKVYIWR